MADIHDSGSIPHRTQRREIQVPSAVVAHPIVFAA